MALQTSRAAFGKNSFVPLDGASLVGQSASNNNLRYYYGNNAEDYTYNYINGSSSAPSDQQTYQQPSKDTFQLSMPTADSGGDSGAASVPGRGGRTKKEPWSWWTTVWTSAVFLLCPACIYCTLGAVICNIFAYADHKNGDYANKHTKLRCAICWSVMAFILGVLTTFIVLVVLFTAVGAQHWNLQLPADYDYVA